MKKKHIIALAIGLVVLLGLVIGIMVINGQKDKNSDYTVHEKDDDTVEIESENGLNQSESEDGPVLDEDNMIDFNGSDADSSDRSDKNDTTDKTDTTDKEDDKTDATPDKDGGNEDDTEEPSEGDLENPDEPEVPETGAWGSFY